MTSSPKTIGTTIDIGTVKADRTRISLSFFNKHATAIVYAKEGGEVSTSNGIPIYPKGSISLNLAEDGGTVHQMWSTISDTANTGIVVFEGYK